MNYMNTYRLETITDEQANEYDTHWQEVLKLAGEYGFIRQSYGGTAILITHENIRRLRDRDKK
jgi:hypothetical protein